MWVVLWSGFKSSDYELLCDQGPEVHVEIILLNLNLDFTIYVWAENVWIKIIKKSTNFWEKTLVFMCFKKSDYIFLLCYFVFILTGNY